MKIMNRCVVSSFLFTTLFSITVFSQNPVVTVSPDSINTSSGLCNDTIHVPLQLTNTGTGPLFFSVLQISDFFDDFEDGLNKWNISSHWGIESNGYDGSNCVTESPGGYYGNGWNDYITMKDSLIIALKDSAKLSFYVKYSLECSYDYLYVQISVNNGSWINLQTYNCPGVGWTYMEYNLSSYVNDGDYIKVRYYFHSDGSVTYDGTGIDNVRVKGVGNNVPWVFFETSSGVVIPGLTETIDVGITTTNLLSGTYQYVIILLTNDPLHPQVFIPLSLDFTGYPLLQPLLPSHNFGSLFENAFNIDTIQITNTGCDILEITDISTSASQFTVLQNHFNVLPGHIINVPIKFLPDDVGLFTSDLYVECNDNTIDPAISIMQLTGTGLPSPQINIIPSTIEENVQCGDSLSVDLVIHNIGQAPLNYNITTYQTTGIILYYPLDGNAQDYSVFDRDGTIFEAVPTTDRFGNASTALLFDGNNDYVDIPDGVYFNGNFTVNAWINMNAYNNWSRLFDFANGAPSDNILGIISRYTYGQYLSEIYNNTTSGGQVYTSSALPLDQWIMVTQVLEGSNMRIYTNGNLTRSGTTTQLPRNVIRVNNFLARSNWSSDNYYNGKIDEFRIYDRALNQSEITDLYSEQSSFWLTYTPASGIVPAGDSVVVSIKLNGESLFAGDYEAFVNITTNDPLNTEVQIPVVMHIYGEPIIEVDNSTIEFGTTMQYVEVSRELKIYNSGCDSLHISSFEISDPAYSITSLEPPIIIPPHDSSIVGIRFYPADTGTFSTVMVIVNDAGNIVSLLNGYATGAPHLVLTPDTSYALIVNCNDSVQNTGTINNTGYVDLNWTAYNQSGGGNTLLFDAYQEWATVGNFGAMPPQGTIEFWTWSNILQSYNNIFCTNGLSSSNAGIRFEEYGSGQFLVIIGNDAGTYTGFTLTYTLQINVWHHVAISWDKIQNKAWLYLDGDLVIDGGSCSTWATNWTNMIIGAGYNTSRWWNGKIDELRIWNYKRSTQEIGLAKNYTLSGNESGLIAYWNFNEEIGSTLNDITGNGHNATFTGATWIESTIPMTSFVTVSPTSGTIAPGDSQEITYTFKAGELNSGHYFNIIPFLTNDPLNTVAVHPSVMDITGSPQISVHPNEMHFGDVMVGATAIQELTFYNPGCDTLFITGIDNSYPTIFLFDPFPLSVLPKDSTVVNVIFSPTDAIYYENLITFYSNTDPLSLFIDGNATSAPSFSFDPALLEASVNCSDSTYVPITIYNNGLADLIINIPGTGIVSGVPVPAQCIPYTQNYCCSMGILHFVFNTIDTVTGNASEGYRDYTATQRTVLLPGQSYPIQIQTGPSYSEHVSVWIDYNNNGIFENEESVFVSYYGPIHSGIITIPNNAVMNTPLRLRVASNYYSNGVPTACSTSYYSQDEDYTVFIVSGIYPPLINDTISALSSETYDVMFSGNLLNAGDYSNNFIVNTNDPLNPIVTIPTLLHVGGGANIIMSDNYHDYGNVMIYTSSNYQITLNNMGCDTFWVYSVYSDNSVFAGSVEPMMIPPNDSAIVNLAFTPDAIDYFEGNITIYTNIGDLNVFEVGYGTPAPSISVDPDVLSVQLTCGESISIPVYVNNNGEEVLHYQTSTHPELDSLLLMYYPFRGNVNDYSGNNRNLINNGAILTTGNTALPDQAYSFSDSSTITYNNIGDLIGQLQQAEVTFSMWVKIPDPSSWQSDEPFLMSISGYYYDYDGFHIKADASNVYASFRINYNPVVVSCPIQIDSWMHLAYTYDGNAVKAYVNGVLCSENNVTGSITWYDNYPAFILGNWNNTSDSRYFSGDLDEIRYYGRSLSPTEILSLYSNVSHYVNIQTDPVIDSVGPGAFHQVNVNINTENLVAGSYTDGIDFISDDPLHPHSFLPISLEVTGSPGMMVTPDCLNYDNIMQFTSQTKEILIENTSCTPLFVTNMYTATASFAPEFPNVVVPPFGSNTVPVVFSPVTEGNNEDTLYIESEAGPYKVCLQGYCTGIPVAVVTPTSVNQVLSCEETASLSIQLRNDGLASMEYEINAVPLIWFNGINESGSLDPGNEISVFFTLNRLDVPTGLYNTIIHINTNDPLHSNIQVPVYLLIPNPLVPVNLGVDTGYCIGGSITLHPGNYKTYLWNDGSTASTLTINTPGFYWIDVVDYYNCPSTDSINIAEFPIPLAIAGADTTLCEGTTIKLHGNSENTIPPFPVEIVIGSGTQYTSSTGPNPFGTYYMDHRSQYLYTHAELMEAGLRPGNITALGFILNGIGNPGMSNFNIRIKTTFSNTISNFEDGLTDVFYLPYYYPVLGQNVFTLDMPFFWDGSSSLIVEVCFDNNGWVSNSSYQYTSTTGCVIARYCDNCAPGCSMGGGSAYNERPNLLIHGDGDITIYHWTGPASFSSDLRNPIITPVSLSQGGIYTLSVNNGYGCIDTDDLTVTVNPMPVINAGSDAAILGGELHEFNPTISGGVPPYSYYWSPSTYLNDSSLLHAITTPVFTTTYTLNVTGDNGCYNSDNLTVTVTPRFSLSGQLTYSNSLFSALGGAKILLKNDAGIRIDSTLTDPSGNYVFPFLLEGNYQLGASTTLQAGSINATDALKIGKHVVSLELLTGLPLKSADVNASNTISGGDALLVLHRTVGNISTFPAGNWYFEPKSVTISGANKVQDLQGICLGDVNQSFVPGLKEVPGIIFETEGIVNAGKLQGLIYPIKVRENMLLGAVTLNLVIPQRFFTLEHVIMPEGSLVYRLEGDILHIAWNNNKALTLNSQDILIQLKLRRTSLVPPEGIGISLIGEGELADASAEIISYQTLLFPRILATEEYPEGFWLGQNQPNPFSLSADIPYYLPEPGKVTLEIYNVLGEKLMQWNEGMQSTGQHFIRIASKDLANGVYYYHMTYQSKQHVLNQTRSLIISK